MLLCTCTRYVALILLYHIILIELSLLVIEHQKIVDAISNKSFQIGVHRVSEEERKEGKNRSLVESARST